MRTSKQYLIAEALEITASRLSRIKHGDLHAADLAEAEKLSAYFETDIRIWFKGGDVSRRQEVIDLAVMSLSMASASDDSMINA